jgi:hypothetical protein
MPSKSKSKPRENADWFDDLDQELEEKTKAILEHMGEEDGQRMKLNKTLISDMWKIWKRFNKINIHFAMEPSYTQFAHFEEDFPYGAWNWRSGFNLAMVDRIQLLDRTQEEGRVGDTLIITYPQEEDGVHMRAEFQYCEGEHYYKYSGWRRIFAKHRLYDTPVDKVNMGRVHAMLKDLVSVWYESHLRKDRTFLLNHLKNKYPQAETFSQ